MSVSKTKISRRNFIAVTTAASTLAASLSAKAGDSSVNNPKHCNEKIFDYIIVGAGPGGGPIAANLVEAGYKVALIEAGINPLDSSEVSSPLTPFLYQVPLLFTGASESNELSWDFYVKHYDDINQQQKDTKYVPEKGILYPRGSALGGSASHNAMVWMYPHDVDFDRIADLTGDRSWESGKMRQYFERVERCGYCTPASKGRGLNGYMPANMFDRTTFDVDPVLEKLANANERIPGSVSEGNTDRDVNHPLVSKGDTGAFNTPQHNQNHVRITVAERLMEVRKKYPERLYIFTSSLAAKIITVGSDNPRAIGVELMVGKNLYEADKDYAQANAFEKTKLFAKMEVVVSAGTFNTPQLLMLSGIGDKKELKKHKIKVVKHLPGVGKNLQDRYEVPVSVVLRKDLALLSPCRPNTNEDPCFDSYFTGVWDAMPKEFFGPYSLNGILATRIEKSSYSSIPDIMIAGLPIGYTGIFPGYSQKWAANRWTWLVLKGHTNNNGGVIKLRSSDPRVSPDINFHHFEEGEGDWKADLASVVEGVKIARSYLSGPDIKALISYEVTPGEDVQSDSEIEEYIRNETWGHHASCSAKIGANNDPMAVLDSKFRVRGVRGLRVCDASAFPFIPGFFPVASIFMISEKASDEIIKDAKNNRLKDCADYILKYISGDGKL